MDVSVTPESDALSNDILRRTIDRIATIVNLGLDKLMSGIIDELTSPIDNIDYGLSLTISVRMVKVTNIGYQLTQLK